MIINYIKPPNNDKDMKSSSFIHFIVGLIFLTILLLNPFITIWSLNTLFKTNIEYTGWTWLAMNWINFIVVIPYILNNKKKE